jgi:hypothetical protein
MKKSITDIARYEPMDAIPGIVRGGLLSGGLPLKNIDFLLLRRFYHSFAVPFEGFAGTVITTAILETSK